MKQVTAEKSIPVGARPSVIRTRAVRSGLVLLSCLGTMVSNHHFRGLYQLKMVELTMATKHRLTGMIPVVIHGTMIVMIIDHLLNLYFLVDIW